MINGVQIPEQIRGLLLAGVQCRAGSLEFEGPFPDRLVVGFSPDLAREEPY
jgi:hypothetical protein